MVVINVGIKGSGWNQCQHQHIQGYWWQIDQWHCGSIRHQTLAPDVKEMDVTASMSLPCPTRTCQWETKSHIRSGGGPDRTRTRITYSA